MKKYLLIITILLAVAGCNNDLESEGLSRITYFPDFELEAGDIVLHPLGAEYAEPGVRVTEEGSEISFTTTGSVDTSTPGFNAIVYSAVNKDGFPGSATRTVVVVEPDVPSLALEGNYTSNTNAFSGQSLGQKLTVTKLADGVFASSDSYAHPSLDIAVRFLINADGTATLESMPNSPFGIPMNGKITFGVPAGGDVHFPDGTVQASPVAADMAFGIILDDDGVPSYQLKTWVKD